MGPIPLLDFHDESRTFSRFFAEVLTVEIKKKSLHDSLVDRAFTGDLLKTVDPKGQYSMFAWFSPYKEPVDVLRECLDRCGAAAVFLQ